MVNFPICKTDLFSQAALLHGGDRENSSEFLERRAYQILAKRGRLLKRENWEMSEAETWGDCMGRNCLGSGVGGGKAGSQATPGYKCGTGAPGIHLTTRACVNGFPEVCRQPLPWQPACWGPTLPPQALRAATAVQL